MRYGIFSDIHSNIEALDAVIKAYSREEIDRYLCVGDVVGYAANPKECIEKVKSLVMATVAGNHDWGSVKLFSTDYFNPLAKEAILWTERNLNDAVRYFLEQLKLVYKNDDLSMVHGTLNEPQDFDYMIDSHTAAKTFELMQSHICFVGHTHIPGTFVESEDSGITYGVAGEINIKDGNRYIVNVGSVGQPRDGNPKAAYCIYDTVEKKVQIKRVNYDIEAARKKIIDRGLPKFLGDRLLEAR